MSRAIENDWLEPEELSRLTTDSIIDHMLWCQKRAYENLHRTPHRDENENKPLEMWSEYRNQVMLCLQSLTLRGIYEGDPYRDDKGNYTYLRD